MKNGDRLDELMDALNGRTAVTQAEAEQLILEYGKIPSFEIFIERAKRDAETLSKIKNQQE